MVNSEEVGAELTPRFDPHPDRADSTVSGPSNAPGGLDQHWPDPEEPWAEGFSLSRQDVSLASMLMLGAHPWQRIDGMGMARQIDQAPLTGDPRHLTDEQRFLLANARAWCLLVYADLGHQGRRDDPFVLADAERHVALAERMSPRDLRLGTSRSLLRLRQGVVEEALHGARQVVDRFGVLPERDRDGETQGVALLALLVLALAEQAVGNTPAADLLATVVMAVRTSLEVDEVALRALLAELQESAGPRL